MGCWGFKNYEQDSVLDQLHKLNLKLNKELNLTLEVLTFLTNNMLNITKDDLNKKENKQIKNKISNFCFNLLGDFKISEIKKTKVDWKEDVMNQFNIEFLCYDFQILIDLSNYGNLKLQNLPNQKDILFCMFLYQAFETEVKLNTYIEKIKDSREGYVINYIKNNIESKLHFSSDEYKEVLIDVINYIDFLKSKEVKIDNEKLKLLLSLSQTQTSKRILKI